VEWSMDIEVSCGDVVEDKTNISWCNNEISRLMRSSRSGNTDAEV
jgi:hypothetical protein